MKPEMGMKLSDLTSPAQLRDCSQEELKELAQEIRMEIIRTVSQNGGHLASNLGVVELTLALHRVFDCPRDRLIFDVGHQCYAHKMITGRYGQFATLRQMDGLSGFPRRDESEYDAFGAGHASTAISAAVGMARARDLMGENYKVAAIVGDGALTGGMCYEALNDAGSRKTPMMVVLNDNGMSISRNVGALSGQLTRLRVSRGWLGMKRVVSDALRKVPAAGKILHRGFLHIKNGVRNILVRDKFFTSLGFRYFGPIDGHDLEGMEMVFRRLRDMQEPVVVHVVTRKGAGFVDAEEKPEKYHGVSPFQLENGLLRGQGGRSLGKTAGEYLTKLARDHQNICVITAAMTDSAGFGSFAKAYPERLFDVGIAEEHAVTTAAGMAAGGMRPFVAIYETFLQRGYDQIVEDVCLQNLPVCFLMDRAGLGGEDGPTHHGVFGVSMLRHIPNLIVLSPRCEKELESMLDFCLSCDQPVAIRYPRAIEGDLPEYQGDFQLARWEKICDGSQGAILASSGILSECMKAVAALKKEGLELALYNASSLTPLDENCLIQLHREGKSVFTVEEHILAGGFGSAVAEFSARWGLNPPRLMLGLHRRFVAHGARGSLLRAQGLDETGITEAIKKAVKK